MIEKWRLTIHQNRTSEYGNHFDENVSFTHNRLDKLVDVASYINDSFPERCDIKIESVNEEEDEDEQL